MHAAAVQSVREAAGESVESRFRGPVHVVGATHPRARDGREHDDLAAALGAQQLGQMGQDTDLRDEVGMDHGDGVSRVLLGACLVAENPERENRDRQWAVFVGDGPEHRLVDGEVVGVELDALDRCGARIEKELTLRHQVGAPPRRQHDDAATSQPGRHLEAYLAAPTQQENGAVICTLRSHTHRSSLLDYRRHMARTPSKPTRLTDEAQVFLAEYHLATLTTLRKDGTPHVVAVGVTWDQEHGIARVITSGGSQKALNADRGGYAAVSHVDGARWLTLEGPARVLSDADSVAGAVDRYAARYRQPRINPQRVVIEIAVSRVMGSASLTDR